MPGSYVSRRKFYMHAAHKRVGVSTGLAAWPACEAVSFAGDDERQCPLRVCLVSGTPPTKPDRALGALQELLTRVGDVRCLRALREQEDGLHGLDELETTHCAVFLGGPARIEGQQLEHVKRYSRRGGAIVGIRTAGQALQDWPQMDTEVFGGNDCGRYEDGSTDVTIVDTAHAHPVLAGVGPFMSTGPLHACSAVAADANVLLFGSLPGRTRPVAWTRIHNRGRVFYTSLGHADDFHDPNFLRLLRNAIRWTANRPPTR